MKELKISNPKLLALQQFFGKCEVEVKFMGTGCQLRFFRPKWKESFYTDDNLLTLKQTAQVREIIYELKKIKLDCWCSQSFDKKIFEEIYLALLPGMAGKDFKIPSDEKKQLTYIIEGLKLFTEIKLLDKENFNHLIEMIEKKISFSLNSLELYEQAYLEDQSNCPVV